MKSLRILVTGRVQGVGFRPFLARLAQKYKLSGEARNVPEGVELLVSGTEENLSAFLDRLRRERPPLARITRVSIRGLSRTFTDGFHILESRTGRPATYVPPDMATCRACLDEVFEPGNRRFGYPFTNCTDCGPRYTVIEELPYDRAKTSMREFLMCPDCLREYGDLLSRRFHAEPNACPVCGPRLWVSTPRRERIPVKDLWQFLVRTLREGAIWAVKGLGGFHLVCDAESERTVRLLRERKRRPTKPLAVMVRDLAVARRLAEISPPEAEALLSRRAPIVLCRKRKPFPLAEAVAPGINLVGIMLPYTPLHHLLLSAWPGLALVMTSGNLSEEPLCFENEEALERLSGIVDFFLLHDRRIVNPVDDSVVRFSGKTRILIRRARGWVPDPLPLPEEKGGLLAVGALLKNTFALSREAEAFLSPHLGDLESLKTLKLWQRTLERYRQLLAVAPEILVSDLHPDYLSTRIAEEMSGSRGLPHLRLQHHAAHAYSALGGRAGGRALALVLDGAGLGEDGTIRGGEILLLEGERFRRVGCLEPFLLPGGEAAEREPWRVALALLKDLYGREAGKRLATLVEGLSEESVRAVEWQIERKINTPRTTSAGRLFEAVAVLLGLGFRNHYEGELALRLECLASGAGGENQEAYPAGFAPDSGLLSGRDLIIAVLEDLRRGVPYELIALRFHLGFSRALVETCAELSRKFGVKEVALSGGCFQNALLLGATLESLRQKGLKPLFSEEVPPNDGGLSYGQAVWASLHNF